MTVRTPFGIQCAALAAALLGSLSSCREPDPLSPPPVEEVPAVGVFVLRTVAGQPLPVVTTAMPNYESATLADTLVLRADGSGLRLHTGISRFLPAIARDTSQVRLTFTHRRSGNLVLAAGFFCDPPCYAGGNGMLFTLDGEWLLLIPGPAEWRYQRIDSLAAH